MAREKGEPTTLWGGELRNANGRLLYHVLPQLVGKGNALLKMP